MAVIWINPDELVRLKVEMAKKKAPDARRANPEV
jgi:hypothetical protein